MKETVRKMMTPRILPETFDFTNRFKGSDVHSFEKSSFSKESI